MKQEMARRYQECTFFFFIDLWFLNIKDMRFINKREQDFLENNKLVVGRISSNHISYGQCKG